jgi:hypoxanthine phosphoribosyltransferase
MINNELQPLISRQALQARIAEMGSELALAYRGQNPLLVAILKGSYMFLADLSRAIDEPHQVDFVATAAYSGVRALPGHVRLLKDMDVDIDGRHVLIVEDIVDSGRTLSRICELFMARNPASLRVVTLLDKPEHRVVDVPIMLAGFHVPDAFVVGYGLDLAEQYRHLDGIYICADQGSEHAENGPNRSDGKKERLPKGDFEPEGKRSKH